ncbi:succinyl-diaminopimelate desuccinylase [Pseudovibrio exalbescens]|uniref:succinyl-diaminopimelate desuccinylase n=1 Tax=Pseudovibrio exalbescens TaxID=197461 RepID=UPI002366CA1A|nr:succinyl-diaminopimelate desuccinylase [Pseudovibrio exalbescens]MDD7910073.1 succinyl-diaminopimelate desuccinylase [Pseudovibrio exalbescens]
MTEQLSPAVEICRDLIRCPSVTPAEAGALQVLEDLLKPAGFEVHRPIFSQEGTPDVENLFATIGSGKPHFVFAGHTDVVPVGDEAAWSHGPFEGAIVDGMLHGRGTADMKGGVAAFAAAALAYVKAHPEGIPGQISFLITGDEEGPAINGTVKLLEWAKEQGYEFDACIVGEPTNPDALGDAIKVGRRGSLSGAITVRGVQGHVAYQHLAENPIPGMLKLLSALANIELDRGNERFQPSNLEITSVDVGNAASNIIPAKVEAKFNVRFNDTWSVASLQTHLQDLLKEVAPRGLDWELQFKQDNSDSFLTHDTALIEKLSSSVEAVTGRRPELSTGGGTSDARFIKNYCAVVEFGLVGKTMHKVDEQVAVKDLEELAVIYGRFLNDYFAS